LRILLAQFGMLPVDVLQHVELVALLLGRVLFVEQIFDRLTLHVGDIHARVPMAVPWNDPGRNADPQFFEPPCDSAGLIVTNPGRS